MVRVALLVLAVAAASSCSLLLKDSTEATADGGAIDASLDAAIMLGCAEASQPDAVCDPVEGDLELFRVDIHNNGDRGIHVLTTSARLAVEASRIRNNANNGLFAQDARLRVRSSLFHDNQQAGLLLTRADVEEFSLNTLVDNNGAVSCTTAHPAARLVGNYLDATPANCGAIVVTYGYAPNETSATNLATAPTFADIATNDYRLAAGSLGINFVEDGDDIEIGSVDANGFPRVVDGKANIGAFEEVGP